MFKKKEIIRIQSEPIDPTAMHNIQTADDFVKRGLAYYARKQFDNSERDFVAVEKDPKYPGSRNPPGALPRGWRTQATSGCAG